MAPGLDTALVLRTAAVEGPRRSMLAGAGVCCGLLIWGLAASAGLGALLAASRMAYTALRIVGACYLIFLGTKILLRKYNGGLIVHRSREVSGQARHDGFSADSLPTFSTQRWEFSTLRSSLNLFLREYRLLSSACCSLPYTPPKACSGSRYSMLQPGRCPVGCSGAGYPRRLIA